MMLYKKIIRTVICLLLMPLGMRAMDLDSIDALVTMAVGAPSCLPAIEKAFEKGLSEDDKQAIFRAAVAIPGNDDVVSYLLEQQVRPDIRGYNEETLLHVAAAAADASIMRQLLEWCKKNQVSIELKDGDGATPLCAAVGSSNKPEVLKELIKFGASLNTVAKTGSPLFYAIERNDIPLSKMLLRHGADAYAVLLVQDVQDQMIRVPGGHVERVEDREFKGSCFKMACKQALAGNPKALNLLVDYGWRADKCAPGDLNSAEILYAQLLAESVKARI